jgi:SagB-type dehydrogenase family enzyme
VTADGAPLYILHPARERHLVVPEAAGDDTPVVVSRFAVLHRDGERIVAESPRAWCDVELHDPALLAAFGLLARPAVPASVELPLPAPVASRFLADLLQTGFLVPAGGAEDAQLRLRQWSPFELWLHTRSRLETRAAASGSWGPTGWLEADFAPLPSRHEPLPGKVYSLHRPDIDALRDSDPSLTTVIEQRRSIREHDTAHPLTAEQLGEFLFRCARVRGVEVLDGIEHLDRPFPSGGALHELEIYPAIHNVTGLPQGLYHYDPHTHHLTLIADADERVARVFQIAEMATGSPEPQAVLLVAARFGRLMTKYEGMGYAAILKNVGALYQTMYCVATAMGLAPCAIGGGDAAVFNEATGLDYFTESIVGEFLLGSRAATGEQR